MSLNNKFKLPLLANVIEYLHLAAEGKVRYSNVLKKYKNISLQIYNYIPLKHLILFLGLFYIFGVFITGITLDPYLVYDDSNTLNISSHSTKEILEILSYEQNFPSYYLLAHLLITQFHTVKAVVIFNLVVWVCSIIFFYRLIKTYISADNWSYVYTLLFVLTSSISYYAYHTRMYGLIILLVILYFYSVQQYIAMPRKRWIGAQGVVFLGLSLLHPAAILTLPIIVIVSLLLATKRNHFISLAIFGLLSATVLSLHFIQKSNLYESYLSRGIEYIAEANHTGYSFFVQTLFFPDLFAESASNVVFYIFILLILFKSIFVHRLKLTQSNLIPVILSFIYIFFSIFFAPYLQPRHLLFFVIPVLLTIFIGLQSFTLSSRVLFSLVLFIFFLGFSLQQFSTIYTLNHQAEIFCSSIRRIRNSIILTDFSTFNFVERCDNGENEIVVLGESAVNSASVSAKDLRIYQARSGGLTSLSMWEAGSSQTIVKVLKQYLDENTSNKNIFFARAIEYKPKIFADELLLFNKYIFSSFEGTSILVFEKKE